MKFDAAYYEGEPSALNLPITSAKNYYKPSSTTAVYLHGNLWCKPATEGNYTLGIPYSVKTGSAYEKSADDAYYIRKYAGTSAVVNLASDLSSYTIVGIGTGAFADNTALRRIYLPASIATIKKNAFNGCTGLVKAFSSAAESAVAVDATNTALTDVLTYGVKYDDSDGFVTNGEGTLLGYFGTAETLGTNGLINSIDGKTAFTIGEYAFAYNDTVTGFGTNQTANVTISDYAFYECSALNWVTFKTVSDVKYTFINQYAFGNCTALATVSVLDKAYAYISAYAFNGCIGLTTFTHTNLINLDKNGEGNDELSALK